MNSTAISVGFITLVLKRISCFLPGAGSHRHSVPLLAAGILCLTSAISATALATGDAVSLTLIPPGVITEKTALDIRAAVRNESEAPRVFDVAVYMDTQTPETRLYNQRIAVPARSAQGLSVAWEPAGHVGTHKVLLRVSSDGKTCLAEHPIRVEASGVRSTGRLSGAWVDLYHHDESEGRPFNEELAKMTGAQWRELVRAMHAVGQDIIVITMMFQNFMHVGKHDIEQNGYQGRAYYPSNLYAGRMPIASEDPLEAILEEADALDMHVLPGVGVYAFFDFTPASLAWHEAVADELWERYGSHKSFYGWYVSDEVGGNLGENDDRRRELVTFFEAFRAHVRLLAPDKPVMLATNCHFVDQANGFYARLLPHLDILCPFGFARMPADDMTGEAAAAFLQQECDAAGCHLWMDLESFEFRDGVALYPRPISGIIDDLERFRQFETILHYQFPGMMCSPEMSRRPGGDAAVRLYMDYRKMVQASGKTEGTPRPEP